MLRPRPPTTEISASIVLRLQPRQQLVGQVDLLDHLVFVHPADVERVDPGRLAEETRAVRIQVLDQLGAEGHQPAIGVALRVQQPVEPVPDADHLPSQPAGRQGRAHDHGIDPRDVAGAHHDGDAPEEARMTDFSASRAPPVTASRVSRSRSPARVRRGSVRCGVAERHAVPVRRRQALPKLCSVRAMISSCTPLCSRVKKALKPATRTTRSRYFSGCFCASLRMLVSSTLNWMW